MNLPSKRNEATAEIHARVKENRLDTLTVQDVLDALQRDGIRDLEQLVKIQLDEARTQIRAPRPINLFAAHEEARPQPGANIHHPPHMPVVIDGVLYDPKDISRFDGQALHFIAPSPEGGIPLQAFTGNQWQRALRIYFQTRYLLSILDVSLRDDGSIFPPGPVWGPPPPTPGPPNPPTSPFSGPPPPPPPPPTSAQFFSDSNYQGDWLWLDPGQEWPDLTQVSRSTVLFFSSNWNDVISSLIAWAGTVILYQDINMGGSSFTVPTGRRIADLTPFGWNDLTSSIANYG